MEKRNVQLDAMRGMAIILVAFGHAHYGGVFGNWIYAFHMPLFFFISGYFCSDRKPVVKYVYGKLKTLYFPFVFYYALFISLSHFFHAYGLTRSDFSTPAEIIMAVAPAFRFRTLQAMDLLGQFWFLPVLFFISVMFYLMLKAARRLHLGNTAVILAGGVITLVGSAAITMNTPNPYDIRRILFYNGFFALGWYVANTGLSKSRIPWYTTAILFVSLTSYAIYNDPSRQYSLLGIVAAVVGVMFSWGLCQEVKRWQRLAFVLSYIGKQTMAIYVWHVFCFKCFEMVLAQLGVIPQMTVGWHGSFRSTMLGGIAYTLVGVLVPVSFGWVKDKVIIHFQYIQ